MGNDGEGVRKLVEQDYAQAWDERETSGEQALWEARLPMG